MGRVLLIHDAGATAVRCDWRGRPHYTPLVDPAELSAWLDASGRRPLTLILDLASETFHREPLPPVRGRDRQRLIERAVARHVDAAGCHCARRSADRHLLIASLPATAVSRAWFEQIATRGLPVRSVHAAAFCSEAWPRSLGLHKESHLLLLTRHVSGWQRQTYYAAGQLRFSRVAAIAGTTASARVASMQQEHARMLAYLQGQWRVEAAGVRTVLLEAMEDPSALRSALAENGLAAWDLLAHDVTALLARSVHRWRATRPLAYHVPALKRARQRYQWRRSGRVVAIAAAAFAPVAWLVAPHAAIESALEPTIEPVPIQPVLTQPVVQNVGKQETAPAPLQTPIRLRGLLDRGDRSPVVWLDAPDRVRYELLDAQTVRIQLPDGRHVDLRAGQTWDPVAERILEAHER